MTDSKSHRYTDAERAAIYRVIAERRDMRHFSGGIIDPLILGRLLAAAHQAPSVGLMQPWRFIRVVDQGVKQAVYRHVDEERGETAAALGERKDEFMRLKVEGILDCAELLVAALQDKRDQHIFGRRTLPEMDLASLSCAIQNLWLAARAEGLGMGWVSIFQPEVLKDILSMPAGSHPVAILCLGPVEQFYAEPMLVTEQWTSEKALEELVYQDSWGNKVPG